MENNKKAIGIYGYIDELKQKSRSNMIVYIVFSVTLLIISFVFMKATEGSSFVDECFEYNFEEVQKTEFAAGEAHTHDFAGTQTTFNNMPPYFTVNMWYRTA